MDRIARYIFNKELSGGFLLLLATIFALILANSSWQIHYHALLNITLFNHSLIHWINDGLMSIFFFQIGLELKRERYQGHLREVQQIVLPSVAALGGIVVPMLIYFIINYGSPQYHAGWAIPMATDIAFALTVLSLFGKYITPAMKTFLLTLAIMDDLGAIIVIALFHTQTFSFLALLVMLIILLVLWIFNKIQFFSWWIYLPLGIGLWLATLNAGIHPTIAGVLFAFAIPLHYKNKAILPKIETMLLPWVSFLILPIFAFANAGIGFSTIHITSFVEPVTLGIILGLLLGKPLGICLFTLIYTQLVKLKTMLHFNQLLLLACLAGIGFTMSLFLADLSFKDAELLNLCRLGILTGSFLSALLAAIIYLFKKSH